MKPAQQSSKSQQLAESRFGVQPEEIIHAIRRRKWLILAASVLIGLAVLAGTMRQRKVYQAVAQLIIDPVLPRVMGEGETFDNIAEQARAERVFLNTQYQILGGRIVLRRAAVDLGLTKDNSFLKDHKIVLGDDPVDAVAAGLADLVAVSPHRGSRIVKVSVEDFEAARAARIANGIAQAYKDLTLERRRETTRSAHEWLHKRVGEFATKLEKAETELHAFMRDNTLLEKSLDDRQKVVGTKLATLNERLVDVRTKLLGLRAKRSVLRDSSKGDVDASEEVLNNPVIANLKNILAETSNKRAELASRYGPKHHTMQAVDKQIAELKALMNNEKTAISRALDNQIAALEKTEHGIAAMLAEEGRDALKINELAIKQSTLNRDYGTTKATYESLLKRQTEADLSESLPTNFVRWFEQAETNPLAVRPSLPKNGAVGALLGLLLGLAVAVGSVLLDNTLHSQVDIEQTMGLPFLGILPSIEKDLEAKKAKDGEIPQSARDLYIIENTKSSLAECARSIRTNLLFMTTDQAFDRLLVTSPGPSEGKSTISVNLSIVMAQAGNRVLLVDTDLRKPRLHRTFGVSGEQGLTSALLQRCSLDEAIKSTDVVGLDILPCGPLPPNPAELLHTESFQKLLTDLDERYDRIVFDSPPVNAVTDASILAQLVNGTLLVGKVGKTAKESFRRACRQMYGVNANIVGCVLNGVDLHEGGYGRANYYYYYYPRYSSDEKGAEV